MPVKEKAAKTRPTKSRNGAPARNGHPTDKGPLTAREVADFQKRFDADPKNRMALNAVTKTTLNSVAQNRQAVTESNHVFSNTIKVGQITSQNSSGRCWLFAGLNPMRVSAMNAINVDDK